MRGPCFARGGISYQDVRNGPTVGTLTASRGGLLQVEQDRFCLFAVGAPKVAEIPPPVGLGLGRPCCRWRMVLCQTRRKRIHWEAILAGVNTSRPFNPAARTSAGNRPADQGNQEHSTKTSSAWAAHAPPTPPPHPPPPPPPCPDAVVRAEFISRQSSQQEEAWSGHPEFQTLTTSKRSGKPPPAPSLPPGAEKYWEGESSGPTHWTGPEGGVGGFIGRGTGRPRSRHRPFRPGSRLAAILTLGLRSLQRGPDRAAGLGLFPEQVGGVFFFFPRRIYRTSAGAPIHVQLPRSAACSATDIPLGSDWRSVRPARGIAVCMLRAVKLSPHHRAGPGHRHFELLYPSGGHPDSWLTLGARGGALGYFR